MDMLKQRGELEKERDRLINEAEGELSRKPCDLIKQNIEMGSVLRKSFVFSLKISFMFTFHIH